MGAVSIIFYVGLTLISANILADTIAAVGLMIAFYYGLTGFACVWFYRKTMWASRATSCMQGVHPARSAACILLLAFFICACKTYADPDYGYTSIGGVGGVFLHRHRLAAARRRADVHLPGDLARRTSAARPCPSGTPATCVLVPADGSARRTSGCPDSGEMPTVIAPDLSNLPPGQEAIDPTTTASTCAAPRTRSR